MARKYPITAKITTVTTKYLRYDPVTKLVIPSSTETVKEFTDEDMFDKVTALRKVDFYACDVYDQIIERDVQYGMTEDTFAKIAKAITKEQRRGLLSRSKKQSTAKYSTFDETAGQFVQNNEKVIPLDIAKKGKEKALEYLRKDMETSTFHILSVTDIEIGDGKLYGVDRNTFKMNAVRLTKEEAEEAEETLEEDE